MASFVGTNSEFRHYIGPRLRNVIQQITMSHKAEISACEHCGSKEKLESAHVKDRNRNDIVDLVLKDFTSSRIVNVELNVFEEKFKQAHYPIEKAILVLCHDCHDCHKKYDSNLIKSTIQNTSIHEVTINSPQTDIKCLPITLEPSDQGCFKKNLLGSRKAEIETHYQDGRVERKLRNVTKFNDTSNVIGNLRSRPDFRNGNWQSKGILRVHVKVLLGILDSTQ
jgi:hypothetical protein